MSKTEQYGLRLFQLAICIIILGLSHVRSGHSKATYNRSQLGNAFGPRTFGEPAFGGNASLFNWISSDIITFIIIIIIIIESCTHLLLLLFLFVQEAENKDPRVVDKRFMYTLFNSVYCMAGIPRTLYMHGVQPISLPPIDENLKLDSNMIPIEKIVEGPRMSATIRLGQVSQATARQIGNLLKTE